MTNYKKDCIVKGSVTGIEKYGIFVNLDNYYSGLIHISEISNGFVNDINEFVKIGETIYVKVIDVDETNNQVKLSIKDIDYKIEEPTKEVFKIKEVGTGFTILEKSRDLWINEKIEKVI